MSNIKQVIVIRKDLKLRRGKEIAQGSHASMKFLCDKFRQDPSNYNIKLSEVEQAWIHGSFAKICLQVNSEVELLALHQKALGAGLVSCLIQDSGKTELRIPTYTCIAIGPDLSEKIDPITSQLSLY